MTTAADPAFWGFLQKELAPKPGRLGDSLKIAALTVLVIVASETFRIPLPAYSAYIVFFTSKEEKASTVLTGIVGMIGATIALAAALLVYMISAGEPGLRIPLMALAAFTGLFFSRVSPLGPASFIIGFVMTVSLTLIDVVSPVAPLPGSEILTQTVLWLWVVVLLPVGVVLGANLLIGRQPEELFRRGLASRLLLTARLLSERDKQDPAVAAGVADLIRSGVGDSLRYLKLAGLLQKRSSRHGAVDQALVARTHDVMTLTREWRALGRSAVPLTAAAAACGGMLRTVADCLENGTAFAPAFSLPPLEAALWEADRTAALLLERLIAITNSLPDLLAQRRAVQSDVSVAKEKVPAKRRLLVADAFSNPEHVRFALKVTLAVSIAYFAYNLLDWPDIRTAMITCFFVTLGSVGETFHKMTLRMAGALIGGGLGLAAIVFVMPHLTSITDLCLLIAVVAFMAAWVSLGSERLSYAGMQMAMAFFFSVLVGYGPSVDLSLARDRVVGILLGDVIVWMVFSNIWPVSALAQARQALSAALRTLAAILSLKESSAGKDASQSVDGTVFAFDEALAQCWRLLTFELFEPGRIKPGGAVVVEAADADLLQSIFAAALILGRDDAPLSSPDADRPPLAEAVNRYRADLGSWLSALADLTATQNADTVLRPPPEVDALVEALERAAVGREALRLHAEAEVVPGTGP